MRESDYQSFVIKDLNRLFPGCFVLMNDAGYRQGIPDLIVLYKDSWFALEVKASATAPNQPNQEYYIDLLNGMSFAAFIYPENHEEVMSALHRTIRK